MGNYWAKSVVGPEESACSGEMRRYREDTGARECALLAYNLTLHGTKASGSERIRYPC